jgi:hypothetical protein
MRKNLILRLFFSILTMALTGSRATTFVPLNWEASPDATNATAVVGYKVYYSLHPLTNVAPGGVLDNLTLVISVGNQTNATVNGLLEGHLYYFSVTTVHSLGTESDFSNVITYTTPGDLVPELPSLGDSGGTVPVPPAGSGSDSGLSSGPPTQVANDTPTQLNLVGLLPRMWMGHSNGAPVITLGGAVGATFTIQVATNVNGFEQWTTVTNVKMSTIAANTPPLTGNALNKAFVPSLESWTDTEVSGANFAGIKFYRIYMPDGYAVVADQVLKPQGYNTRLVAVRLAALNAYVVCYVTEEGIYLDYNDQTFIVKTQQSGPSIREIATTVSTVLGQNWTSASEFSVTDGLKQILATVVETDSPLSDPPLGSSGGVSIAIDF